MGASSDCWDGTWCLHGYPGGAVVYQAEPGGVDEDDAEDEEPGTYEMPKLLARLLEAADINDMACAQVASAWATGLAGNCAADPAALCSLQPDLSEMPDAQGTGVSETSNPHTAPDGWSVCPCPTSAVANAEGDWASPGFLPGSILGCNLRGARLDDCAPMSGWGGWSGNCLPGVNVASSSADPHASQSLDGLQRSMYIARQAAWRSSVEAAITVVREVYEENSGASVLAGRVPRVLQQQLEWLPVDEVRFCHHRISPKFGRGRHKGGPIHSLVAALSRGEVSPIDLRVVGVRFKSRVHSLNNRRLFALKEYARLKLASTGDALVVPIMVYTLCPVTAKFFLAYSTTNEGSDVEVAF